MGVENGKSKMKVAIILLAFCATDYCRKCDTFGVGWTQCATQYDGNGCIMDKVCIKTGSEECPRNCDPRQYLQCGDFCVPLSFDNDGNACEEQFCWPDCDYDYETECWNGDDENGCSKGNSCVKNEDVLDTCDYVYDYYGEYGDYGGW